MMDGMPPLMHGETCKCVHHKFVPMLVVIFGVLFFLHAIGSLSSQTLNYMWPVIVILVGVMKMSDNMCKCYKMRM